MELHGRHLIAGGTSAEAEPTLQGVDPSTGAPLPPAFAEATGAEIDRAVRAAADCFDDYRSREPEAIAGFLERIAAELTALGDGLLERCRAETALPAPRLVAERRRALEQLRLFAALVREGSWVDARLDPGTGERPDLRRMLIPLGPVAVFGASNFPLAISVAGNDTVAALAAGCPVVVKAHPGHPGTCEMLGRALAAAAERTGMPAGVFSLLHGAAHDVGLSLVRHPLLGAVGFTGSLAGGRALFDAAAARPEPIPVFAEMGSINPVFLLPGALAERGERIADGLVEAVTRGVGQFCTNPGLVLGLQGEPLDRFRARLREVIGDAPAATMLHRGIHQAYVAGLGRLDRRDGVRTLARGGEAAGPNQARPAALEAEAARLLEGGDLVEEVFGPSTLLVRCGSAAELEKVAGSLPGSLTATLHGTPEDLVRHRGLVRILERKAGRILFNGFPPGVELGHAIHHGGPYPATLDGRSTSIGTAAILRFVRPVCYQDFPEARLPEPLRDRNVRGIWRLVSGERTRADVP